MSSIRDLIHEAAEKVESRYEIAEMVWRDLSFEVRKNLGFAQLRRIIAAELTNPIQLEFTLDGEPYPLEEVPLELLRRRGYRLIVAGKRLIQRGEAYLAEANNREA